MTKLGRTDKIIELSELASQLALPREGYLEFVFRLVCNPSYSELDKKNLLLRELLMVMFRNSCHFLYSYFAGDGTTRRRSKMVETRIGIQKPVFRSEFVLMRTESALFEGDLSYYETTILLVSACNDSMSVASY